MCKKCSAQSLKVENLEKRIQHLEALFSAHLRERGKSLNVVPLVGNVVERALQVANQRTQTFDAAKFIQDV